MQGRGNHQERGKPKSQGTRIRQMIIRFRLSEVQEQKLIDCYNCKKPNCSLNLYAQQLFNIGLNAYYDALIKNGKINRKEL